MVLCEMNSGFVAAQVARPEKTVYESTQMCVWLPTYMFPSQNIIHGILLFQVVIA